MMSQDAGLYFQTHKYFTMPSSSNWITGLLRVALHAELVLDESSASNQADVGFEVQACLLFNYDS